MKNKRLGGVTGRARQTVADGSTLVVIYRHLMHLSAARRDPTHVRGGGDGETVRGQYQFYRPFFNILVRKFAPIIQIL